jgi:hypothetical protein
VLKTDETSAIKRIVLYYIVLPLLTVLVTAYKKSDLIIIRNSSMQHSRMAFFQTLVAGLTAALFFIVSPLLHIQAHAEEAPATVSSTQLEKLREGEVVVKQQGNSNTGGSVTAMIIVPRSVNQVYEYLRQTEALTQRDPKFKEVKVIAKPTANTEKVKYSIQVSPLMPNLNYIGQVNYTPNVGSRFTRLSGDFKQMEGSCLLNALGPHETLVTYTLRVQLQQPLPQPVINTLLGNDLPRSLKALKKAVM